MPCSKNRANRKPKTCICAFRRSPRRLLRSLYAHRRVFRAVERYPVHDPPAIHCSGLPRSRATGPRADWRPIHAPVPHHVRQFHRLTPLARNIGKAGRTRRTTRHSSVYGQRSLRVGRSLSRWCRLADLRRSPIFHCRLSASVANRCSRPDAINGSTAK